jgi:hypothetical protein
VPWLLIPLPLVVYLGYRYFSFSIKS